VSSIFFHLNILFLILALVFLSTSKEFHIICWAFTLVSVFKVFFILVRCSFQEDKMIKAYKR